MIDRNTLQDMQELEAERKLIMDTARQNLLDAWDAYNTQITRENEMKLLSAIATMTDKYYDYVD